MAGPGRQHGYVARLYRDFVAASPAKHQARTPACKSQNLVRGGVIVMEVINAVAPLRGQPLRSKAHSKIDAGLDSAT